MSVTADFDTPLELLLPRDTITEEWAEGAYQAAPALYEATFDATAPGGTSQVYLGHDHTPNGGGGPIHRGSLWSMCATASMLSLSFSSAQEQLMLLPTSKVGDLSRIYPSPGLNKTASLTGWICYYARNSDRFRLEMDVNGSVYDIDLPIPEEEKTIWQQFALPVLRPGDWRSRNVWIRCGSYDSASAPTFDVYAFQIDETPTVRRSVGAVAVEGPATSGNTILVGFPKLEGDLVAVDEWLDSYALRELYKTINGLDEGIEEQRAPGASSQTCRGHDHDSSNYGGRAIARAALYTAGQLDTELYTLDYQAAYSGYKEWDLDDGSVRRTAQGIGLARAWVGPGLTSSGNPPTGPPYCTAELYVRWDDTGQTPTVNLRALHRASGNYSAVTTVSATAVHAGWLTLDYIPCAGDAINEWTWEVEVTGTANDVDVSLDAVVIYEVPGVGGRTDPGSTKVALGSGGD